MSSKEPLLSFILKNNWLSQEKLAEAIRYGEDKKESLSEALVHSGLIDSEKLSFILAQYYDTPFINSKIRTDHSLFHLLPESVIRKHKVVPVKINDKILTVAMVEPANSFSKEYVQMVSGYLIEVMGILESDFKKIMETYFSSNINAVVKDISIPEVETIVEDVRAGDEEKPIVKLVDTVLTHAVKLSASDIHFEPQEKDFLIRLRIDGMLRTIEILPKNLFGFVVSRIKIMASMNIAERRVPQDGQMQLKILERNIDIRASTLPGRYGEKLVLRILDKTSFLIGLDQVGFNMTVQSKVEEIISSISGMFLVTGPTGSGKTTTLYSCINRIRSSTKNIITLEDPIEYELLAGKSREGGITQVQINPKVGLTFVEGLKAILRQDPDIIFVGEMRDKESAEIAFTAALTGHFVLSSLHTIGSVATVTRLIDMGIEPFLIVSTLKGIIAQRLVRVLCPHCKEAYNPPKRVLEKFPLKFMSKDKDSDITFYRPKGCPWCGKSGYRGRKGIFELLEITDEIRGFILSRASNSEVFKRARESGMMTLRQAGLEAVAQGETTVAEVLRVTPNE